VGAKLEIEDESKLFNDKLPRLRRPAADPTPASWATSKNLLGDLQKRARAAACNLGRLAPRVQ